ncbi:MAG: bifunctional phosphopantothenoylcysteine decarboxylase/phosphopantothenate--cysteine ligase CoaBC [Eggerthellaceae bacterium]|jgi:phosphopantothenoylcysteine decarboxylase/phosphopantothenate--cysteine ligase|nr:bifunctional phosphopantothenoylcysteine decarboxylase/phosphopantothenate--cysteine ligase CoaBC [Eggerthellaceae bacterium]
MSKPHVLLGVTGCIAAYKAAEVLRALQKRGAEVRVVMTRQAAEFVGPATFRALADAPVGVGGFDDPQDAIPHIRAAEWADLLLVAPCTANVAAKLAHGIADDLLTSTALACTAPIMVAPAMNVHMYEAAATQANLAVLRERGVHVLDAESGYLACGEAGPGRLPEPAAVADAVLALLEGNGAGGDLAGRRVLVTAGPTVESVDAVRFLSNRSSGKMGYAVAEAAAARGADVTLVSGPVALDAPSGVHRVAVGTADEMLAAARAAFDGADVAVFAAAVADRRPARPVERKLKKGADDAALAAIELEPTPDVLATLAAGKQPGQFVVGFAAETDDVAANAARKLEAKGADMVVANDVSDGKAFGADDNEALLVTAAGVEPLPPMAKRALADVILDRAVAALAAG